MTARTGPEVDALLGELEQYGLGPLDPSIEQLRELVVADRDGPLQFVNLLAYRELARYPAGHELADAGLRGADAYQRYGVHALGHVIRRGGRLALYNDVAQTIIGGTTRWDQVAVMEYPDTEAFLDMIRDPDYQTGLVDRDAGLADTAVFVTRPLLPPAGA